MPHIKNALIRYRIIDKMLSNPYRKFPTKLDLRRACEEALYGDEGGSHISESTIEKDLFAMRQESDAPIAYSKKDRGYYYTDPNFTINEQPLSDDDRTSIQFALSTLSQFKETALFQQFGSELNRVMDQISVNFENDGKPVNQYIKFEKSLVTTGNEFLGPLISAIKEGHVTYFEYESFVTQVKKQRKVTPLLLKEYSHRWYLICFDMVKQKVITYALDRITELDIVEQKGERPSDFDSDRYFKYTIGITTSDEAQPERIVFEATTVAAKYIVSQPFHQSLEVVEENENQVILQLYALVSEELIRELLSYGGELTVITPKSLRLDLIQRSKDLLEKYSTTN